MYLAHNPPAALGAGGLGGLVLSSLVRWGSTPSPPIPAPLHLDPFFADSCTCPALSWVSVFHFLLAELCLHWQLALGGTVTVALVCGCGRNGLCLTLALGGQERLRSPPRAGLGRIEAYRSKV